MDWRLDGGRLALDPLIAEAKRRARRRRVQLLVLGGAAVAGAVVGAVVLLTPTAKVSATLSADGVMVEGSGSVCAGPGGVFFSVSLPGVVDSPPPTVCDGNLRVRGLDLSRVRLTSVGHGVQIGSVEIKGVDRNGVLTVAGQGPPQMALTPGATLSDLPCQPPAGGWPAVRASGQKLDDAMRSYRPQSDFVVSGLLRSGDATVGVVASTHPARVRHVLGRRMHGLLCVIRSRYSKRAAEATSRRVEAAMGAVGIEEAGPPELRPGSGQPVIDVWTGGLVTPELRAFLHTTPPGLIKVFPGLRRVRR